MSIQKILIKEWGQFRRKFYWRNNPTPFKIMIAEFMLQRTKAVQVEPVYNRFLKQYPTVSQLSNAKSKSVSKYTSQLGLHWRYKHFISSAKYVVKNLNGRFPHTRKELINIPGIGDYVGGAIAAVCFNKADYVIDSNIARFINRYYNLNLSGELRRKKLIIERAKKLFNTKNQRDLLFALLDYTALVCKPIKPDCEKCIFKKCKTNCSKL